MSNYHKYLQHKNRHRLRVGSGPDTPIIYGACHTCGLKTRYWDCYICSMAKDPIYQDWNLLRVLARAGSMG
jgi:hypothetical protein